MWFLAKAIAIYFYKKTEFDSKKNHGCSKLAYFWLADSEFYFTFLTVELYILWELRLRNAHPFWKAFKSSALLLSNW